MLLLKWAGFLVPLLMLEHVLVKLGYKKNDMHKTESPGPVVGLDAGLLSMSHRGVSEPS